MGFWEPLFFWLLAFGALASSIAVLLFRNPLYSALALVGDFLCFAGLYVLLSAHFMAVVQVLVYGGAIMVLFLFIIMLLNLSDEDLGPRRFSVHHVLAVLAAGAVFVFVATSIVAVVDIDQVEQATEAAEQQIAAQQEAAAQQEGEEVAPDQPVIVDVPSSVPGLSAFMTEDALQARYAGEIAAWERGERNYATDKYPRFDETQPFVVPPVMSEQARLAARSPGVDAPPEARTSVERDTGSRFGTVEPVSLLLVNRFVVPFELTAVLLLAAIIGAVIIAKKRL